MDHIALLNDAKRMVEGEVIYRDFFELTFPGSHTLYFIFFSIFGTKYWVSSLLILFHGMASAAISLFISRRIIADNIYAYLPPALYIFLGFRWFGIDGEHRMFSPVFAILAVFFLLHKRTYSRIAAAGICCALSSLFTQQRGVLAVTAIGIFLFIEIGLRERNWLHFLRSGLTLGAAFGGSLALLLLPFIIAAGADRFYESTFLFLSSYVQDPTENSLQTYLGTLMKIRSLGLTVSLVAVFYTLLVPTIYAVTLVFLWVKRNDTSILHKKGAFLIALLGIFLAIGTLAPNVPRIYQISLPALIVLAWLTYNLRFRLDVFIKAVIILQITFGLFLAFRLQTVWDLSILPTASGRIAFTSPIILERYKWLSENTVPGDLVYETYNSHVNFPLNLHNPSSISVLLNSGYNPPQQVGRAIEDLKTTKARYIIWDGAWTPEMDRLGPDEKLKPFFLFLKANYRLRQRFTPYDGREREIWERIENGLS
ncbi:MAG: hypothetical protein WBD27_15735 [Pyrinomonadaceae bacterium]